MGRATPRADRWHVGLQGLEVSLIGLLALLGMASQARGEARPPIELESPGRAESSAPARAGLGEFDAALIRRAHGEWVIVSLTPRAATGDESTSLDRSAPPTESDERGVHASLRAYEQALEGRDLDHLGRVWIMNPLEREELRRFFERADAVSVAIDFTDLFVDGDRAVLRFAQRFAASLRPDFGRAFRAFDRALAARDAYGTWSLDQVTRHN